MAFGDITGLLDSEVFFPAVDLTTDPQVFKIDTDTFVLFFHILQFDVAFPPGWKYPSFHIVTFSTAGDTITLIDSSTVAEPHYSGYWGQLSSTIYTFIMEDAWTGDGYVKTLSISLDGTIGTVFEDSYKDPTTNYEWEQEITTINVSSNVIAFLMEDRNNDTYLRTCYIADDGTITGIISSVALGIGVSHMGDIQHARGDLYLVVHRSKDLYAGYNDWRLETKTFEITAAGVITLKYTEPSPNRVWLRPTRLTAIQEGKGQILCAYSWRVDINTANYRLNVITVAADGTSTTSASYRTPISSSWTTILFLESCNLEPKLAGLYTNSSKVWAEIDVFDNTAAPVSNSRIEGQATAGNAGFVALVERAVVGRFLIAFGTIDGAKLGVEVRLYNYTGTPARRFKGDIHIDQLKHQHAERNLALVG